MTYDCATQAYVDPVRPSNVPSCLTYVRGTTCDWVQPDCGDLTLVFFGLLTSPQCACGNAIEHCLQYMINPSTDPDDLEFYPLICLVCMMGYFPNTFKTQCNGKESFTISYFNGQNDSALGTFIGHLLYNRDAYGSNNRGFQIINRSIDMVADSTNPVIAFVWIFTEYSRLTTDVHTIAIAPYTTSIPIYLYLTKTAGSIAYTITNGYKTISSTNRDPHPTILWFIKTSLVFFTEDYYIGSIEAMDQSSHFDQTFTLVAGGATPDSYPFRLYSRSFYQPVR